jgi:hypothetical protein
VISTLRDLRETGDEIRRIEGMFSGTLAYLFNVAPIGGLSTSDRQALPQTTMGSDGNGLMARCPVGVVTKSCAVAVSGGDVWVCKFFMDLSGNG